jgi:hypothetical protein
METRNSVLRGDYWFQTIIGYIMITCCISIVGFYFVFLLAIPFGAWQVISGLCLGIANNDKKRILYVRAVTAYFAVMLGFYMLKDSDYTYFENNVIFDYLFSIIGVVTPIVLGTYYYRITYRAYHNIEQRTTNDYINENILDA